MQNLYTTPVSTEQVRGPVIARNVFFTYNLAEMDCWSCRGQQQPAFSLSSFLPFFLCEAKAKGVFPEDIRSCRANLESLACNHQKDRQGLDAQRKRYLQTREHHLCCASQQVDINNFTTVILILQL